MKLFGWDTQNLHGLYVEPKAVVVVAPHSSMMDFVIGKLVTTTFQKPAGFFMKQEALKWPIIGKILAKWGAIGIDRGRAKNNNVQLAVDRLNQSDELWIILTPEGTRKRVSQWKTGFYRIATEAKVPILISYIDYKKKIGTVCAKIYPSGDYEADLAKIMPYYEGVTPRHPERKR